jgi:hypothetical protein
MHFTISLEGRPLRCDDLSWNTRKKKKDTTKYKPEQSIQFPGQISFWESNRFLTIQEIPFRCEPRRFSTFKLLRVLNHKNTHNIQKPGKLSRHSDRLNSRSPISGKTRDLPVLHKHRQALWPTQPPFKMRTGGSFFRGWSAKVWTWPLTSIYWRDQELWSYTSTPP